MTGTWHWKAQTAAWTDEQWHDLVGRRVSILAPADTVTDVTFDGLMIRIEFAEGEWNFVRHFGQDVWVEDAP